jgi:biopolymer transport protein ExbB/TolQ
MAFFDIFAWIVLLLLVAMGMGIIVLLGFVLWPVVAICAYMKPTQNGAVSGQDLDSKIDALAGETLTTSKQ